MSNFSAQIKITEARKLLYSAEDVSAPGGPIPTLSLSKMAEAPLENKLITSNNNQSTWFDSTIGEMIHSLMVNHKGDLS